MNSNSLVRATDGYTISTMNRVEFTNPETSKTA